MTKHPNQIWKFESPVQGTERFTISMPAGAFILDVQEQSGKFVMWAVVNDQHNIEREFVWVQTGQPFKLGRMLHVKTVQDGSLVFHLFEVKP